MDMKSVNVGFIGAGFIAQQCHLPSFQEQPNCKIIAVADLHRDLVKKIALRYEIPNVYNSHKDLLLNKDINAVVVTLPRSYTVGVVKDCLSAGKHVLTEKPLAINSGNALKLKNLAKRKKVLLYVGYMKRNDSGLKEFKKLIERKYAKNKKPLLIKSSCYMGDSYCSPFGSFKSSEKPIDSEFSYEDFPEFLKKREIEGYKNLINTYSHVYDALNFIFEEPLKLINSNISNEGYGICLFDLKGTPLEVSTAKCSINDWFEKIQVVFEDEIYTLLLPPALLKNVPATIKIQSGNDFYEEKTIRPKWSWAFLNQSEDFLNKCIKSNFDSTSVESAVECIKLSSNIFKTRAK